MLLLLLILLLLLHLLLMMLLATAGAAQPATGARHSKVVASRAGGATQVRGGREGEGPRVQVTVDLN
jgi:hypothetical protein